MSRRPFLALCIVAPLLLTYAAINAFGATGPTSKPAVIAGLWGDTGNGNFVNPVLPADFSDIDCIRVGDDFYAISSTFQFSPGVVILHSKDLVNWTILGHAVDDLTQIGPELNWDRMNRYGHGIWAGSIRFHDGRFWIYFCTPDEGFFMTTATNPAGPWEPLHSMRAVRGWDDCCPFWDDDGQSYLITSNYSGNYNIHLFKMTADGHQLILDSDKIIHQSRGSEANKLYKINGLYYHYFSEVHPEGRVAMMERSASLDGPWEIRQLNHVNKTVDKEPNQGGLIQLAGGDWWFLTHQGTGDWEGRAMVLLPVTWNDGWPIIGNPGDDGIGNMVWQAKKPIAAAPLILQTSDEFNEQSLPPQWEWNYQPRADHWSLTERPGFLRLHAFRPLQPDELMKAGNTLTQRAMRTDRNEVTIKLDVSGMTDGQEAGLCHFAKTSAILGISQSGAVRMLKIRLNGQTAAGPILSSPDVWLQSSWRIDGNAHFAYSLDGKTFTPIGGAYSLSWGNYRGDRVGIYSFNDTTDSGFVDVDWFHYTFDKPAGAARP